VAIGQDIALILAPQKNSDAGAQTGLPLAFCLYNPNDAGKPGFSK